LAYPLGALEVVLHQGVGALGGRLFAQESDGRASAGELRDQKH